ncbi:MAG TPA: hypothetical protein VGF36_03020, partial [Rhodopila sp.]
MRRALVKVAIAFIGLITFADLAVFLSVPAEAGLRFGPGAVLGLVGMPLRMMVHGIGGVPEFRRHVAHTAGAR